MPEPAIEPPFNSRGITLYHGDAFDILDDELYPYGWGAGECVILDPPWDHPDIYARVAERLGEYESLLAFTDSRRLTDVVATFGPPAWLFAWDQQNTWSPSPNRPVQQLKLCAWYGDHYDRDAVLWGTAPPARNHPTTQQTPLDGRRLTDLWTESSRWLHHPGAGSSGLGAERFGGERRGHPAMRHSKPVGWLRCLIGNTSCGPVLDPFVGSGAALVAAQSLGRLTIGVDIDRDCVMHAADWLTHGYRPAGRGQLTLWGG